MFLNVDGTIFVQLVNFVVFFAILNVVFLRPVGAAIRKRRAYINSVTEDYDRYQAEATALCTEAEVIRNVARREGLAALGKARAEASNEAADLATQYNTQAAEIVADATRTIEAEAKAARARESEMVEELAALIVDRTLTQAAR